jgi:tetratricopeptide (TPR) repeat protein
MKTKSLLISAVFAAFALTAAARADTPLDEARAALRANDLPRAETLLTPLTGPDAQDAAALHTLSQVRLAQKNAKEAIILAERATKLDATRSEYFAQLGMALGQHMGEITFIQQAFISGKLKRAFEKSVELDPHNVGGLIGLARFYTNAPEIAGGSLEKAQELARRVREIVPFLGEVELGTIAGHDEKYADALAHYEAAAKLNPDYAEAQNLCGQMLVRLARKDEARACFTAALRLDPNLDAAKKALTALDTPAS